MTVTPQELIAQGALVVVNHSGGKDSQALLIKVLEFVPREQVLVVHASLGEVEWPGALEHAQAQAEAAGVPFIVATAVRSFFDLVEDRFAKRPEVPSWPSASTRQCTSDLKRGPCAREVRRYAKEHGYSIVINCLGIRAAESPARAKRVVFSQDARNTVTGRAWYEWNTIHDLTTQEVWDTIAAAGQKPHPAYAAGNERLSCVFCILASKNDLKNGAKHNPELLAKYISLEKKTGYTFHQSRVPLEKLVA